MIAHDIGGAVALRVHPRHGEPYASLCLPGGAGHLIQFDAPESLTASLVRWLAAVEPRDEVAARNAQDA